jgi:magnesium chelatase family protein
MDEFPEFDRRALEMLREPMEERVVHITRAAAIKDFPADFLLVAAMNPCPCGYYGKGDGRCNCTPRQVHNYRSRISGPLLDRFDLRVLLKAVTADTLIDEQEGEASSSMLERVMQARRAQAKRFGLGVFNATATDRQIVKSASYGPKERRLLLRFMSQHGLSARALRRLQRVALTIADLGGDGCVGELHLMEAAGFRLGKDLETHVAGGGALP